MPIFCRFRTQLTAVLFLLCTHLSFAGVFQIDSLPAYPFLNFDANKILQPDSSSLQGFFEKLWTFEQNDSGKVKILHIGDSHVQGGEWSGTVRKAFHNKFSCGVPDRGYVFPYNVARSNKPRNHHIEFKGEWAGCRSAFIGLDCSWGLSGFNATTKDDSLEIKVWMDESDGQNYFFDRLKLYGDWDTADYDFELICLGGNDSLSLSRDILSDDFDPLTLVRAFDLRTVVDTAIFKWTRKKPSPSEILLHGFTFENSYPGIQYSIAAANGAKVQSFLLSDKFLRQCADHNPDLLILSLGTNDAFSRYYSDSSYYAHYDTLLYQLRTLLPQSNILMTVPGDANRHVKTHIPEVLRARKITLELAQKYSCAVWDWFTVMGGPKSVDKWAMYQLTAFDRLHLNDDGYRLQGKLMYNAIIDAYNREVGDRRAKQVQINYGPNWQKFKEGFYKYDKDYPMLFSSVEFWMIFTIFFLILIAIRKKTKVRSIYLFLFSLFFYYKTGGWYFGLLLFSTIVDYFIALRIEKAEKKFVKGFFLFSALAVNIGLLCVYKYSDFVIHWTNEFVGTDFQKVDIFKWLSNRYIGTDFNTTDLFLPVGISFYTFQTMSYSIDVYRGKIKALRNILDFGFYVSFFPQLVAGPIVRASEFIPQIHQEYKLRKEDIAKATLLILGGLVKKVIISDYIAVNFVDKIFDSPLRYSAVENLMAVYGYGLQIYCDFSAYSDIAIGLALLMGFKLPENFNAPYLATNITSFWRRWHMSLSRWLKDYVYISLGGNRKGKVLMLVNIMITMLIGGLWHRSENGALVKFVIWGGLHGLALVFHKLFMKVFPKLSASKNMVWNLLSWLITFNFVAYCWVYFRAPNMEVYKDVMSQVQNVFYDFSTGEWVDPTHYIEVLTAHWKVFALIGFGFALHFLPRKLETQLSDLLTKTPLVVYPVIVIAVCLIIFQFVNPGSSPFIYFQF